MMTPELFADFLGLPGPRRKWGLIVDQLCEGKSVVWLFPSTIAPESFYRQVMAEGGRRGLASRLLITDKNSGLPGSFLAREAGLVVKPGCTVRVKELMTREALPDLTVIFMKEISPELLNLWARFVGEWSDGPESWRKVPAERRRLFC